MSDQITDDNKFPANGIYKSNSNPTDILKNAKRVLVLVGQSNDDSIAAALALSLYITETYKIEPQVVNINNGTITNAELLANYKIENALESMTLRIEIDHKDLKLEALDYFKDPVNSEKLILEVKPVNRAFDEKEKVVAYKKGLDYDVVVTFGIRNLEDLADNYTENKVMFENSNIINFDNSIENKKFGKINIIDTQSNSFSKLIFNMFLDLRFVPDLKVSRILLIGLSEPSSKLS